MPETPAELVDEMREAARAARTHRPEEVARLFAGQVPGRPGAGGQYFTTFDTAAGMLRDYAGYTIYPALAALAAGRWDPATTWQVLDGLGSPHASFLGYCGFDAVRDFHARLLALGPDGLAPADAVEALSAYSAYVNRVNAWVHHEFPWSIGEGFRYPDDGWTPEPVAELREPVAVSGPRVTLTWQPLDVTVHATLARDQNPALVDAVLASLPFTVLQDHSAVSGESVFAWTPLVTTVAAPVRERVCDAPVGRLRFQQATGQKLVVAYGRTTETGLAPVLGQVDEADLGVLPAVGEAVFASTFRTKDPIWLTVELENQVPAE